MSDLIMQARSQDFTFPWFSPLTGRRIQGIRRYREVQLRGRHGAETLGRIGFTATFLFIVWIAFTADARPYSLVAGALASLALALLGHRIFITHRDSTVRHILPHPLKLPAYLLVLIGEMYISSLFVLAAVWRGRNDSRIVRFHTCLESDIGRLILANSITFTPGTITLNLETDEYLVHWFLANSPGRPQGRKAGVSFAEASEMEDAQTVKGKLEKALSKVVI